jgi:hypothetical protein
MQSNKLSITNFISKMEYLFKVCIKSDQTNVSFTLCTFIVIQHLIFNIHYLIFFNHAKLYNQNPKIICQLS